IDRPLLATPAKDSISSTQTTASDACHSSSGRHLGSASTASGSSHSEYCGDHTLLVSRNAAITRNANWANRGQSEPADSHAGEQKQRQGQDVHEGGHIRARGGVPDLRAGEGGEDEVP